MANTVERRLRRSLAHHAVIAALCALVSYVPIYLLSSSALVGGQSDAATDFIMRLQADATVAKAGPPIEFLDIDNAEYAHIGRPLIFPRDKLAVMLERVAQAHPRLVVVDIDVSWPDTAANELKFKNTLARLKQSGAPPILLVREGIQDEPPPMLPYFRTTVYDSLVGTGSNIRWASADIAASADGQVRRVRPWIGVCRSGLLRVLPGVQVDAWALSVGAYRTASLDAVERSLNDRNQPCQSSAPQSATLEVGGKNRKWHSDPPDRVMFRFGAHGSPFLIPGSDTSDVAFAVLPAAPLVETPSQAALELLRGRIVIIGVSAAVARDLHATPIGNMPGALILTNLIFTQLGEGAPIDSDFSIGLALSLVMSAVTFGAWVLMRRMTNYSVLLLREGLKVTLTLLWGGLAWAFLDHSAVLAFAFPQYVVITYLGYSEGIDQMF